MDKKYVCPCGLVCADCLFYKEDLYEAANRLKSLIEENRFDQFLRILSANDNWKAIGRLMHSGEAQMCDLGALFTSFQQMPVFMDVLESIVRLQCKTTCREKGGCAIGGYSQRCDALDCIEAKGFDGCWQCSDFHDCAKLDFMKHSYGCVVEENLTIMRDIGEEAVKSRGNRYYAWQRK